MIFRPEEFAKSAGETESPDFIFQRACRDLGRIEGKRVTFELDMEPGLSFFEIRPAIRLALGYLIRCMVRSSIETRKERVSSGKQEAATIRAEVNTIGGKMVLRLSDDGKGLNEESLPGKSADWLRQAKRLVRREGGSVELAGKPEGGSLAVVEIGASSSLLRYMVFRVRNIRFGIPASLVTEIRTVDSDSAWLVVRQGFYDHGGEVYSLCDIRERASFDELKSLVVALVATGRHRFCVLADGFEGMKDLRYQPFPVFLDPGWPWEGVAVGGSEVVLSLSTKSKGPGPGSEEDVARPVDEGSRARRQPCLLVGADPALAEVEREIRKAGEETLRSRSPLQAMELSRRRKFSCLIVGRDVSQIVADVLRGEAQEKGRMVVAVVDEANRRLGVNTPGTVIAYPFAEAAIEELLEEIRRG